MTMEYSVRFATVKSNDYYAFVVIDGMEYMVPFGITDGTRVSVLFRDDLEDGYEVTVDTLFSATVDLPKSSARPRPILKSDNKYALCVAC